MQCWKVRFSTFNEQTAKAVACPPPHHTPPLPTASRAASQKETATKRAGACQDRTCAGISNFLPGHKVGYSICQRDLSFSGRPRFWRQPLRLRGTNLHRHDQLWLGTENLRPPQRSGVGPEVDHGCRQTPGKALWPAGRKALSTCVIFNGKHPQ